MPRALRYVIPAVILVLVGGFTLWKLVLEVESPDEVTTDAALEQLAVDAAADEEAESGDTPVDDDATEEAAPVDTPPDTTSPPDGVVGTWTVDDDFGEFGFDSASGSFAGFRVPKSLFTGQGVTAVGRTGGVSGSLDIAEGMLTTAEITVDMATIVSDESGRERAIFEAVRANTFPNGTFVVSEAVALDTAALELGETVTVDVPGELTIGGITNTVVVAIEATVPETGLGLVIGSAGLVWADFDVETPTSIAGTVSDSGTIEFQLVVRLG